MEESVASQQVELDKQEELILEQQKTIDEFGTTVNFELRPIGLNEFKAPVKRMVWKGGRNASIAVDSGASDEQIEEVKRMQDTLAHKMEVLTHQVDGEALWMGSFLFCSIHELEAWVHTHPGAWSWIACQCWR